MDAEHLACLLMRYEADEPHPESTWYPPRSVELLRAWLAAAHHGDCCNVAMTCTRCVAETALHKAQWILAEVSR